DIEVAEIVPGPWLMDVGIPIDHAAERRIARKQRNQIPVDSRVEDERAEDLGAIADADREGPCEIADVRIALDEIRAAAITGHGKLLRRKHFSGRHEPDARVAEKCRGRGPRIVRGRRRWWRRLLRRGRRTLR